MLLVTEKLIMFGICLAFYLPDVTNAYDVVPVLAAVMIGALNSWHERAWLRIVSLLGFSAACLLMPGLVYFLPLISFDCFVTRYQPIVLVTIIPLLYLRQTWPFQTLIMIGLLITLSGFIKWRADAFAMTRHKMAQLQDLNRELSLQMEEQKTNLMDKQETEINLATLNERNRIAREIHDQVGHLLTRAILQTGALRAASQDTQLQEPLLQLNETLTESMNQIRHSLHGLHDPVLDLQAELTALVRDFHFCTATLDYDVSRQPEKPVKSAFLAIVQEGLSNVARHSRASRVDITVREHPALYQLIIRDNGVCPSAEVKHPLEPGSPDEGIGLKNMADRVKSLGGQFNINRGQGFVLFITVPKQKVDP